MDISIITEDVCCQLHSQLCSLIDIYNKIVIIRQIMWSIVFYKDQRDKCPPLEFIEELPVLEQAKIRNAFRLLKEFGTKLGMPHARPIQGKLWEFRPGGVRIFYFAYINKQFVILHGFRKKTNKAPKQEIAIALRRMEELIKEN